MWLDCLQVVVESGKSGSEYDDIVIDASSKVNSDMFFTPQKSHIYVMTEKKVIFIIQDIPTLRTLYLIINNVLNTISHILTFTDIKGFGTQLLRVFYL